MSNNLLFSCFIITSLLVFASCERFDPDVEPEKNSAFIKFFGGGFTQQAADVLELENGEFAILGTSNAFNVSRENELYLVSADENGNEIRSANISAPDNVSTITQLEAVKLLETNTGFSVLVNGLSSNGVSGGFSIFNFSSELVLENENSNFVLSTSDALVEANDFVEDSEGNFVVASTIFLDDNNSEGVIFKLNPNSQILDSVSVFKDGNGDNSFSAIAKSEFGEERFFVVGTSESITEPGFSRVRVAEINTNGQIAISEDRLTPSDDFIQQSQTGVDIVIIGPTQAAILGRNGDEITGSTFFGLINLNTIQPIGEPRVLRSSSGNVLPNRMTRGLDGTLLITGSIQGAGFSGGDIYVDRVDISGNEINFPSTGGFLNYGGDGLDEGAVTFQGRDGGLVTLGSNSIDGTNSLLMLIKTDVNGFFN
ncbi:MAG: hypothetical protein AAF363_12655 [Bacteroidota bacterium]